MEKIHNKEVNNVISFERGKIIKLPDTLRKVSATLESLIVTHNEISETLKEKIKLLDKETKKPVDEADLELIALLSEDISKLRSDEDDLFEGIENGLALQEEAIDFLQKIINSEDK